MLNTDSASVYTDFNGLAKLKQGAREQSPEAIKEVAKQFESVFLSMMLKSMRQAKLAEGALDSKQSEFFRDMYDQQLAVHLAGKPGIGLAELIAQQLSPKQKSDDEEKLQAGDYLNRALGSKQALRPAGKLADIQALTEEKLPPAQAIAEQEVETDELVNLSPSRADALEPSQVAAEVLIDRQAFMKHLLPYARRAAAELGTDANILLAQAALETGWGKSVINNGRGDSSFNLFNIKADKSWQGRQARVSTLEYSDGVAKREMAGFRSYHSFKQSFEDYVKFIKSNPRYSEALKKAGNAAQYVWELQKAGYATDPRYAEKIISIYNAQMAGQSQASAG